MQKLQSGGLGFRRNTPLMDVIILGLCLKTLIDSATNTNFASYRWGVLFAIILCIGWFYFIILWGNRNPELVTTAMFSATWISYLFAIQILLYNLGTMPDSILFAGLAISSTPVVAIVLFTRLTRDTAIQTSDWGVISRDISKYSSRVDDDGRPLVVALIPILNGGELTYRRIKSSNLANLNPKSGKNPVIRQAIQNGMFLFLRSEENNKRMSFYNLPSETSYQQLNNQESITIPAQIKALQRNAEAHFLMMLLFGISKNEATGVEFDVHNILRNMGGVEWTVPSAEVTEMQELHDRAAIIHEWPPHRLIIAGDLIYKSLTNPKKGLSEKNISESFFGHAKHLDLVELEHLLTQVAMLHYGRGDSDEPSAPWMGALQSYAASHKHVLEFARDDGELTAEDDPISKNDIRDKLQSIYGLVQSCFDNPVEKFIENHDAVLQLEGHNLGSVNEEHELSVTRNETTDRMIHALMDQLRQTRYKRTMASRDKYDTQELIDIRQGMVSGVAISLNRFTSYLKGGPRQ
jgi:hypothetical protein